MPNSPHNLPQRILESLRDGLVATDRRGRVLFANAEAGRLLGLSAGLEPGLVLEDVHPELARVAALCLSQERPLPAQPLRATGASPLAEVAPLRGDAGTLGAVCVLRDSRALDELAARGRSDQEINRQLESIINSSVDGIWIIDAKGFVLRINAASEEMHGFRMADVAGLHVRELRDRGLVDKVVTPKVLATRQKVTEVATIRGKQVLATGSPVFNERGEMLFIVVNERDMTELNALREQSELSQMKMDLYKEELNKLRLLDFERHGIIAESESMLAVLQTALKLARLGVSNVLIRGESGTGKGLVAKYIHSNSARADRPFMHINCAAIPENLLESELFGYETGAFTGALEKGKAGLIELAHEGTLFLDEIGDMPLAIQAKVLNYLDDNTVRRVGGTISRQVDCMVIAATNRDLAKLAEEKQFRQDLFYRLNTFPITLLPLHQRAEDIAPLALHYIESFNQEYKLKRRATPAALFRLQKRRFHGNVRELRNLIKRAVVLSDEDVIDGALLFGDPEADSSRHGPGEGVERLPLKQRLQAIERGYFEEALRKGQSTRQMARMFGVDHSTVVRKLQRYGLTHSGVKTHQ